MTSSNPHHRPGLWQRFVSVVTALLAVAVMTGSVITVIDLVKTHKIETDLMALLPSQLDPAIDPALEKALRDRLKTSGADTVTILLTLNAKSPKTAEASFDTTLTALYSEAQKTLLTTGHFDAHAANTFDLKSLTEWAKPYRSVLLTQQTQKSLEKALRAPDAQTLLTQRVFAGLANPASLKLLGFDSDPFLTFDAFALEKLAAAPVSPMMTKNGIVPLVKNDMTQSDTLSKTAALFLKVRPGIASGGEGVLTADIQALKDTLNATLSNGYSLHISAAGVPLFTDAIAAQAKKELTLIGALSSIIVTLLAWCLLKSVLSIGLMTLSVVAGFASGIAACAIVFGNVSVLTLVFGATLIGMAVDYSSHWFMAGGAQEPWLVQRKLWTSLLLAGGSTIGAFAVLLLTPLPGLKQMAVFSSAGILTALLIVLGVFPWIGVLTAQYGQKQEASSLLLWLSARLPNMPRLSSQTFKSHPVALSLSALTIVLVVTAGLAQLQFSSGIKDLQGAPAELIAAQADISKKLALPSPAQVIFVSAPTMNEVLEREEALANAIEHSDKLSHLTLTRLSDFVPSAERQALNFQTLSQAQALINEPVAQVLGRAPAAPDKRLLTPEQLKTSPFADLSSTLVLEQSDKHAATLVMLAHLTASDIAPLTALCKTIPGVAFMNITSDLESILSLYRDRVLELLLPAMGLLFLMLFAFLRRDAWRTIVGPAFGIVSALAAFGWLGVPVTLFSSLALVMLLGLGVDIGIFLTRSPSNGRAWCAVLFSGLTTMASFGLLLLSSTPALSSFGLTVFVGLSVIWVSAPLVRPADKTSLATEAKS